MVFPVTLAISRCGSSQLQLLLGQHPAGLPVIRGEIHKKKSPVFVCWLCENNDPFREGTRSYHQSLEGRCQTERGELGCGLADWLWHRPR